uniref:Uncharacterized protein n=1 Tax=Rhizophora mucronata TaxID=61149 RepID=A0A2P2QQD4_RHIMU
MRKHLPKIDENKYVLLILCASYVVVFSLCLVNIACLVLMTGWFCSKIVCILSLDRPIHLRESSKWETFLSDFLGFLCFYIGGYLLSYIIIMQKEVRELLIADVIVPFI